MELNADSYLCASGLTPPGRSRAPLPTQRLVSPSHRRKILFQKDFGGALDGRQQVRIAHQVGHAQVRQARLAGAQQLARTAQFQVTPRDLEAIVGLANRAAGARAPLRSTGSPYSNTQSTFLRAATHASAQLVQLREAHALGVLDDHQRGVRHVDAHFDDGGGD